MGTSPLVRAAFADMGSAMKDPVLRFWSMEHWPSMVGAPRAHGRPWLPW